MSHARLDLNETTTWTRRLTWLSVGVAAILTVVKVWASVRSGSVAVLASAADSAIDLTASGATFLAVRYAAAPPDREHRFGHGKMEALASLLQAALVVVSAALIAQEAAHSLRAHRIMTEEGLALGVMVVSMILTTILVTAQTQILKRAHSVAVAADRAHYATDLGSNILALAGVAAATKLHLPALDAISGLLIAAILVWSAVSIYRQASDQLLDHELPEPDRQRIISLALEDPAMGDVHQLRTRSAGPVTHIQFHATLDPGLSLEAAHRIMIAAETRILKAFPAADILIHPDPRGRAEPHPGVLGGAEAHMEDSLA
ncbi:MAG: cation transporter [Alphaproteobacteria bacterium]|nr:cation transporter [Alphaproteobacteria bacterium]